MKKRQGINRRKFIITASAGLAGAYVGLHAGLVRAMMGSGGMGGGGMGGGGMGGGGMGGTTTIDPPPGGAFEDIPIANRNGDGIYELTAGVTNLPLNGTQVSLLTYNGMYPGPVIRAKAGETGDSLKINLTNNLDGYFTGTNILGHDRSLTNLHTHGLHVSPSGIADNMMRTPAGPGDTLNYVYDLSKEGPGHLNFYHPHVHGTVAEQYWCGLAGPLVIEDQPGSPLAGYRTHVMMLKDITINNGFPEAYTSTMDYMRGKEGNLVMVNGQVNPRLSIKQGEVQRWQIVNACNARFFKLSLDKHSLYLVGTDGGLLDKPYQLTSILLSPGERIDVLVMANQTGGSFKFLSLPYDRGMGSMQQVTLLTLEYEGFASDSLPGTISMAKRVTVKRLSRLTRRQMTLSMMMGQGYINGISFTGMNHTYSIMSSLGTYEIWDIFNQSGMDHPFHQHVNSCQVLSISGGDSAYASLYTSIPAWKDVVIIPKMGSATLLVPVMDWPGMTMFHCHIVEHEDIGMMGMWDIMEGMGM